MTDATRDDFDDDDRLPWLEAVEEEETGPSPVKLIAAVVIGLLAIGIVVGGLFWLGNRSSGGAGEELIASPGEYKVPAPEAGGLQLDNSASTQIATSEGTQQNATLAGRPSAPAPQPAQQQTQAQPTPQRPAAQAQQPAPAPAPRPQQQPRLSGPTIQVGAFPSEAAAQSEWRRLASRYPNLGALQHRVMVHQRGGQTFYRLRAAGAQASDVCRRLRSAGQPCMDVND